MQSLDMTENTMYSLLQSGEWLRKKLKVLAATEADDEFMIALFASTQDDLRLLDLDDSVLQTLLQQQFRAQSISYKNDFPDAEYFLIEVEGDRAGRLILDTRDSHIRIVDLALTPQVRGKGYGTQLLNGLKQLANERQLPLILSVRMDNSRARSLYARLGFTLLREHGIHHELVWRCKRFSTQTDDS